MDLMKIHCAKLVWTLIVFTLISKCETQDIPFVLPTCCQFRPGNPPIQTCPSSTGDGSVQTQIPITWEVPEILIQNSNRSHTFLLQKTKEMDSCPKDTGLQEVRLNLNIMKDFKFLAEGTFAFQRMYYRTMDYCISGTSKNNTELQVKICKKGCGEQTSGTMCLPKCCNPGQIFNENFTCTSDNADKDWAPQLYIDHLHLLESRIQADYIQPNFLCTGFHLYTVNPDFSNHHVDYLRFRVLSDGRVTYRDHTRTWVFLSNDEYCVEGITDGTSNDIETVIQTCARNTLDRRYFQIYPILMIVSSLFILATITVYVLLWEKQNIHGWNTMSQSVSMFLFFVFLGMASLLTEYRRDLLKSIVCKVTGILAHFFLLSTFLWLTLISFDLWCTFSSGLSSIAGVHSTIIKQIAMAPKNAMTKGVTRFVIYSLVGWGIPFSVVAAAYTLDNLFKDDEDSELPLPEYGDYSCYVASYSQAYYVYSPIAILMTINIILFVHTSFKLYKYRESTKMATKQMKNKQHSFELFAKLFFVMGISWVFEVISWAASDGEFTWYWFIFDVINIATPIAIFLIFVVKWDILYQLERKYPILKPAIIPFVYLLQLMRCKRPDHIVEEFTSLKTNETNLSKSFTSSEKH